MEIRVSEIKFKRKPNTEGYFKIQKAIKTVGAFKDVSLKELAWYIGEGHSVILAKYKKVEESITSIGRDLIESLQLMTLDVETEKIDIVDESTGEVIGKKLFDKPLEIEEVEQLLHNKYGIKPILKYKTFSHTEQEPRARLIFYIERPVTVKEYESMLKVILNDSELKGRLDDKCKNANRLWQGTDKGVQICKDYKPVTEDLINRLLKDYETLNPSLKANRKPIDFKGSTGNITDLADRVRIKKEYREEVKQMINSSIDIIDFLQQRFNLQMNRRCGNNLDIINCNCPIHGGRNEKGFAIYRKTNTAYCFGDCDQAYSIMKLGYIYYNQYSFNNVALTLIEEYNLPIQEKWLDIL